MIGLNELLRRGWMIASGCTVIITLLVGGGVAMSFGPSSVASVGHLRLHDVLTVANSRSSAPRQRRISFIARDRVNQRSDTGQL